MGGIEPAREYLLRAMRAGRARRHAPTSSCSPSTARSCSRRPASTASGCASRPPSRARCRSCGCSRSRSSATPIERIHGIVNGTTNFILTEMARGSSYAEALAEAQRSGYAEADPSDDVSGRDAAAKMAILARLAFGSPVHLDEVRYEGIEHLHGDDLRVRPRARPRPEADRHRRAPRRRALGARASDVPLLRAIRWRRSRGPFNAVTVESETITEITMSGPGPAACRRPARCSGMSSA